MKTRKLFAVVVSVALMGSLKNPSMISAEEGTRNQVKRANLIAENPVNLSLRENALEEQNTTVDEETGKEILYYQTLKKKTEDATEIAKIDALLDTLASFKGETSNSLPRRSMADNTAISLVNAYFNMKGYKLSSELLLHARDNTSMDSIYSPVNGNLIESSAKIAELKANSLSSGSSAFAKDGQTAGDDLYYAIRGFTYYKSASKKCFVLRDRYDYHENSDTGVAGVAINWMYTAQRNGVLTPFYTEYEINDSDIGAGEEITALSFTDSTRILNRNFALGKGEKASFNITFSQSGEKVFQTLGNKDTYMSLYSSNGDFITSNDDGGYRLNSFVHRYLAAGTYKVQIRLYSSESFGVSSLIVNQSFYNTSDSSSSLSSFDDIYLINSDNFSLLSYVTQYHSFLTAFKPLTSGSFTTETHSVFDSYLYLLDPRNPFEWEKGREYDDDSGDDLNSKITRDLSSDVTYLTIYSEFNPATAPHDLDEGDNLTISFKRN
jgi:hypothetical protein